MLSNLFCYNACGACPGESLRRGEDCPEVDSFYDAWQEELATIDKIVDRSGGRSDDSLCLPRGIATCGASGGGVGSLGPHYPHSCTEGIGVFSSCYRHRQAGKSPFIEIQSIPVLGGMEHSSSSAQGAAVHRTGSVGLVSSASTTSTSSMSSMPDDMPDEAAAEDVRSPRSMSPHRAAARLVASAEVREMLNRQVDREGTQQSRELTTESAGFTHWRGRCGFVARLRPETPEGPWMCHHFTVDGVHCVRAGLGPEHANSCAGFCRVIETETFEDLADPPRCMGLRKPLDGPGCPSLIRCGPATVPTCSKSNCPFLARGRQCPYVRRARARDTCAIEEHSTVTHFNPHVASTRHGPVRGCGRGILIEPEDDFSTFHLAAGDRHL
jgi:hypothetical protein